MVAENRDKLSTLGVLLVMCLKTRKQPLAAADLMTFGSVYLRIRTQRNQNPRATSKTIITSCERK